KNPLNLLSINKLFKDFKLANDSSHEHCTAATPVIAVKVVNCMISIKSRLLVNFIIYYSFDLVKISWVQYTMTGSVISKSLLVRFCGFYETHRGT
uniref:Uncharacterized protein n=1 Tax=Amphimedon queenslandica TaxID=400682 RepID=A0A1X7UMZ7_AMPQE